MSKLTKFLSSYSNWKMDIVSKKRIDCWMNKFLERHCFCTNSSDFLVGIHFHKNIKLSKKCSTLDYRNLFDSLLFHGRAKLHQQRTFHCTFHVPLSRLKFVPLYSFIVNIVLPIYSGAICFLFTFWLQKDAS